jgi:hypothetical protein
MRIESIILRSYNRDAAIGSALDDYRPSAAVNVACRARTRGLPD